MSASYKKIPSSTNSPSSKGSLPKYSSFGEDQHKIEKKADIETTGVTCTFENPVGTETKTPWLWISAFGAVLGSLQFGYNTGVINAPESSIKHFLNETKFSRYGTSMSDDDTTSLFSLIVSIFACGGGIGGLSAGWWADRFGRKNGLLVNTVFGFIGAALMGLSEVAGFYEFIIAGRFFIGINCGLYTGLTPMYLSEISTSATRGALGVLHQLGVVCGILISQILGFPELLGNDQLWYILLALAAIPCVLQVLVLPFCPESPRYLFITKREKNHEKTLKALSSLRGSDNVQEEMEEINREALAHVSEEKMSFKNLLMSSDLRMPLIISVVMHLSQQLSGINGIFYYSVPLFKDAGMDEDTASHASSGVGGVMVIMTIITIPLMDRAGRRTLHLIGLAGMFIFSILITMTLVLRNTVDWLNSVSIVVSLIYVCFFALGPGSIPWLIVSEMFNQSARPSAMSLAVLVNWLSNFGVGFSFPYLQKSLGDYVFLPFTGMLLLFWIFTYVYVPETKGRTIEDLTSMWSKPNKGQKLKEDSYLM